MKMHVLSGGRVRMYKHIYLPSYLFADPDDDRRAMEAIEIRLFTG